MLPLLASPDIIHLLAVLAGAELSWFLDVPRHEDSSYQHTVVNSPPAHGHMSGFSKAGEKTACFATHGKICCTPSASKMKNIFSNQNEKNYRALVNHHEQNIFEAELLKVISRRKPSL